MLGLTRALMRKGKKSRMTNSTKYVFIATSFRVGGTMRFTQIIYTYYGRLLLDSALSVGAHHEGS